MAERPQSDHIYDSSGKLNSTGSANAYVIEVAEQIAGYHQGMPPIRFKANFGNTGSATANIATQTAPSGLGAVTLKKYGGATSLASGDIVSGGVYTLIYDGTNFQVLELNAPEVSVADGTSAGLKWNFDSSTAMADPGTGDFRLNNATLSNVTAAAISDLTGETGNPDASAWVLAWDDSTNSVRGTLIIKKFGAEQNFAIYNITDASTDNSGWTQLALTYVSHNGSFSAADACVFSFARSGNVGASGADGAETSVVIQVFTASDTYTPTAGMNYCIVEVQAPGGGGGGADGTASENSVGGGGGGGEYARAVFDAATIGASKAVTIGAVGTAGSASGPGSGGTGGTTSLGTLITAIGGSGGTGSATDGAVNAGGAGGTGGGGTPGAAFRVPGGRGGDGYPFTTVDSGGATIRRARRGPGGGSFLAPFGEAAIVAMTADTAGTNGANYGGGGSGASDNDATGSAGGAGGAGIIVITEYVA
jgi:hypothetical protein